MSRLQEKGAIVSECIYNREDYWAINLNNVVPHWGYLLEAPLAPKVREEKQGQIKGGKKTAMLLSFHIELSCMMTQDKLPDIQGKYFFLGKKITISAFQCSNT